MFTEELTVLNSSLLKLNVDMRTEGANNLLNRTAKKKATHFKLSPEINKKVINTSKY